MGTLSCINNNAVSTRIAMTSQSPRIYIYKITFEEVLYYYYGVHKEKKFGEYYMGSPVTNKWCWDFYTPKKQILEVFPFTDEGWLEAQEVETRLIKPSYNTDKWCLNESCGGIISISSRKKSGRYVYENKIGCFKISKEERLRIAKKVGYSSFINRTGVFSLDPETRSNLSKIQGEKMRDLNLGIFSLTKKEKQLIGIKNGERNKNLKLGICGLSKEERSERCKEVNSQKWKCLVTGHISNAGGLSKYQKKRGISTNKRIRIYL